MVSNERLFQVAVAYYEKGNTKSEIGERLGVSHVQVGKYLKLAQDRGIVEIVLNPPSVQPEEQEKLSRIFKELYGLDELVLVPGATNEKNSHVFIIDSLIQYLLDNFNNEELHFGSGLGRFMTEISETKLKVVEKRTKWKFYPVLNYASLDMNTSYHNCISICDNYIKNWGVSMDKRYKDFVVNYVNKQSQDFDISTYYKSLEFIIGGVGVPFPRNPDLRKTFFKQEDEPFITDEIEGDYLNYYFDESGAVFKPTTLGEYSISLDVLKSIRKRIAVASGYSKIASISALLKTGLANVLVTDLPTARNILSI